MALLRPTLYRNTITEISAADLHTLGVKGILLDIDNTLTEHNSPAVAPAVLQWLRVRQEEGFLLILVSNNKARRVSPFAETLQLPFTAKAQKPRSSGFRRAASQLGLTVAECAVIGDQIFTDIVGANLCGMPSVLLEPLAPERHEPFLSFKRMLERPFRERQRRNL